MTAQQGAVRTPPRGLVKLFWRLHRAAYRLTGGRFGLQQPASGQRFGMMRLASVGRRSGKPRVAIVGYFEDGPNLVTMAMNGWGMSEPAWWLNLQANPDTVVGLRDGPRAVRARAATAAERDRLWPRFREFPGWGDDVDALAARRPMDTTVVVFEPRDVNGDRSSESPGAAVQGRDESADEVSGDPVAAASPVRPVGSGGRRLRLRHLWILPGLAIAVFASGQAEALGVGIVPLLVFSIAPDVPRLLGLGQPHAPGQMPRRALPGFNVMHHPLPPLAMLGLGVAGVLPAALTVGAIAWLGHLVIGLGVGDRRRRPDGFIAPLWPIGAGGRSAAPERPSTQSAEGAA
jgi:deazaflavin-dependent oxidoreductase (nitroreductase family)